MEIREFASAVVLTEDLDVKLQPVNYAKVAVMGHSRLGKAALVVAALAGCSYRVRVT